jgi:histidyl-tRNA synthetase
MDKSDKTTIYEKAVEIARYYGFSSVNEVLLEAKLEKGLKVKIPEVKEGEPGEINRPGIMKAFLEYTGGVTGTPIMVYHTEPLRKTMKREEYGGKDAVLFALEIIGVSKSIAEALLFKVTTTILNELGFANLSADINSLGDRESIVRFTREFNNYYKKHADEVPAHCRANLKKDIFKVLECAQDKCMLFKEHAPKPIGTLTENSRGHFAEVLEFLESMDIPYSINNCLVGGKDYYTRTIFEIKTEDTTNKLFPKKSFEPTLARGGRYDDLAKKLGNKRDIPAVGITLTLGGLGIIPPKKPTEKKIKKPKIYLIHLGFEAKIKSLAALEILRRGKVPIYQSLSKDRLSAQITVAENMKVPFMLIIGQKEALEGSAIIRNMKNRSQETVPVSQLPHFIKLLEHEN